MTFTPQVDGIAHRLMRCPGCKEYTKPGERLRVTPAEEPFGPSYYCAKCETLAAMHAVSEEAYRGLQKAREQGDQLFRAFKEHQAEEQQAEQTARFRLVYLHPSSNGVTREHLGWFATYEDTARAVEWFSVRCRKPRRSSMRQYEIHDRHDHLVIKRAEGLGQRHTKTIVPRQPTATTIKGECAIGIINATLDDWLYHGACTTCGKAQQACDTANVCCPECHHNPVRCRTDT